MKKIIKTEMYGKNKFNNKTKRDRDRQEIIPLSMGH